MAEIVILNKWRAQRDRRPQVRIGEREEIGEILFFTGVRYERYDRYEERMDLRLEYQAVGAE
jgi:hypothetical protein